jgi:uncharacterized protein (DUF952 family)
MGQISPDDTWPLRAQIRGLERQIAALRRLVGSGLAAGTVPLGDDMDRLAYESHFQPGILYHITPADYYAALPASESYLPQGYEQDGFIHCTRGADLLVLVANRHFRHVPHDFVMLVIDAWALTSALKYEALDSAMPYPFPHIYGPLNREAIVEVVKMIRAADGTFLAPPLTDA